MFLALIYLAFISLGLPDSLLGSAWPLMYAELGVPVASAGLVSLIISGGTIVASLFSHRVIRRLGTGRVTVASVAMTALSLLGFSLSPSFLWLLACAVPLGLGAGAVDSGLNGFVAAHYAAKHMNWLHCFWGVGAMLGPILISALSQRGQTWRSGYLTISILQFALVALLLFSLRMWKKFESPGQSPEAAHAARDRQGLFAPLRAKAAPFSMLAFFLDSCMEASMMLWGASYLVKTKGVLPEAAAGWVSLFFLGMTAGRMLSGLVSMRMRNEALIRLGGILAIAGFGLMLLPLPAPFAVGAYALVGLGLAPVFPGLLHRTPISFGKEHAQAAMGFQMAFSYTATTFIAPLLGQLFARVSFALMPWTLLLCGAGLVGCVHRLEAMGAQGGMESRHG